MSETESCSPCGDEMLKEFDEMVVELNLGHNLTGKQENLLARMRQIVFGGEE